MELFVGADGVVTVRAASARDARRGQGFVHGLLRSWQVELETRTASGRLAQLLGPSALVSDALAARLEVAGRAAEVARSADAEERRVYQDFGAGYRAGCLAAGPTPEHRALGVDPELPSEEELHAGAATRLLMLDFLMQQDWLLDLVRVVVEPAGGAAAARQDGNDASAIVAAIARTYPGLVGTAAGSGSNAWAVAPGPGWPALLAGDPHMVLRAPATWLPIRLVWPGTELVGAGLAGTPDLALGSNTRVAWATTAAPASTTRLTRERLSGDLVDRPGGTTERLERREAHIDVRGWGREPVELRRSSRGTMLGLDLLGADGRRYDLAVDSVVRRDPYRSTALGGLENATDIAAAAESLRGWRSVPQAVVLGDSAGATAVLHVGMSRALEDPALASGWIDPLPGEPVERHRVVPGTPDAPAVAANDVAAVVGEPGHFDAGLRGDRIRARLKALPTDLAGSVRLQLDVRSVLADRWLDRMLVSVGDVPGDPDLEPTGPAAELLPGLVTELAAWDREVCVDLRAPLVFARWWEYVLGAVVAEAAPGAPAAVATSFVGAKAWLTTWGLDLVERWLDRSVGQGEALRRTLLDAIGSLHDDFGDSSTWTWGRQHTVRPEHPLVGTGEGLEWLTDCAAALPGSDDTVCRGDSARTPRVGVTMRLVIDLAAPQHSVWAFAPASTRAGPGVDHDTSAWEAGRYTRLLAPTVGWPQAVLLPPAAAASPAVSPGPPQPPTATPSTDPNSCTRTSLGGDHS